MGVHHSNTHKCGYPVVQWPLLLKLCVCVLVLWLMHCSVHQLSWRILLAVSWKVSMLFFPGTSIIVIFSPQLSTSFVFRCNLFAHQDVSITYAARRPSTDTHHFLCPHSATALVSMSSTLQKNFKLHVLWYFPSATTRSVTLSVRSKITLPILSLRSIARHRMWSRNVIVLTSYIIFLYSAFYFVAILILASQPQNRQVNLKSRYLGGTQTWSFCVSCKTHFFFLDAARMCICNIWGVIWEVICLPAFQRDHLNVLNSPVLAWYGLWSHLHYQALLMNYHRSSTCHPYLHEKKCNTLLLTLFTKMPSRLC